MKRLNNNELAPNFIALAIKPIINNAIQSKRVEDHIKIVRFFLDELPHQSSLPTHDVVDTQSNLSTIILRNIISMLGFDYSIYETKEKLLDERLLKTRNQVAHGNYLEVTENDLYEIQDECILLMEAFRTQIDNAISLGTYKNIPD